MTPYTVPAGGTLTLGAGVTAIRVLKAGTGAAIVPSDNSPTLNIKALGTYRPTTGGAFPSVTLKAGPTRELEVEASISSDALADPISTVHAPVPTGWVNVRPYLSGGGTPTINNTGQAPADGRVSQTDAIYFDQLSAAARLDFYLSTDDVEGVAALAVDVTIQTDTATVKSAYNVSWQEGIWLAQAAGVTPPVQAGGYGFSAIRRLGGPSSPINLIAINDNGSYTPARGTGARLMFGRSLTDSTDGPTPVTPGASSVGAVWASVRASLAGLKFSVERVAGAPGAGNNAIVRLACWLIPNV